MQYFLLTALLFASVGIVHLTLKRTTKLKLSKTENLLHCAVELPPCLVLELASRPSLSDARSRATFEPIEMCTRSVFLVQIFRRTSVQYNSGLQTDCLYNECIRRF